MRLSVLFFCLLLGFVFSESYAKAPAKKAAKAASSKTVSKSVTKKTDAQISEQKNALKKLESDLAKKRQELALLETEEKGVLNTISILDQNLNQTRTYITELSKSEIMLERAIVQLSADIDSLDAKIAVRKEAMKKRIRTLYVSGRYSEARVLYSLLTQDGNPDRQVYWVHHVLNQDHQEVEMLQQLVQERDEKKQMESAHLSDAPVRVLFFLMRDEHLLVQELADTQEVFLGHGASLQNGEVYSSVAAAVFTASAAS